MCKIVAFLGSPRKNGYTNQLINKIIDGAKSTGSEIVVYDLNAEGIRCCQGCFYCRDHEDCAIKDTLSPMYEDIKTADGIILGSPIYFGTVSSQVKIWLDRMYPMYAMDFSPRFPGKKAVSVFAQANPDLFYIRSYVLTYQSLFIFLFLLQNSEFINFYINRNVF